MGQENNNIKKRKWKHLSERERYKIEALAQQGLTPAEIAASLEPKRDRRTIEREIARGSVEQRDSLWREKIVYLADAGQRVHDEKAANKGRGLKIGHDHALAGYLEQKIGKERWSPDAAIGAIKTQGLQFAVSICTKTVYNMIDRGDFLNLSNKDLPVKKNGKRRDYKRIRKVALNNTKGRSIEERPSEVDKREEYGNWEMDCVVGSGNACLLVLTERKYREEIIIKLANKTQGCVIKAIDRLERRYKSKFRKKFKSFTMDNGGEFLDMKSLERSCLKLGTRRTICYYAHPYSAWERGSNEVNNKLIRRFVPKGTNIEKLTNQDIKRIEHWMNNYPRRMFGYKSSYDLYNAA
jgi:IS30 family transposase